MFIVSLTYHAPLEQIDAYLAEHVAFLKEQYAQGHFLASGRKVPRTGGIILARAASKEALEALLHHDPFYRHDLAGYDIVEFIPSMSSAELAFLCES